MLTTTNTGLLVVDIQGKLARLVEGSDALIANTARLVAGARLLGLPVVWLEQNPDKLGATGVSHWLVCGIEAHICVYQTVLGLLDAGSQVSLVVDAVSSRSAANRELAIHKLAAHGAELTSVEMSLYELLGDCRHPAFRSILALIK
ncbi:UNVERIFIED_CONTAM: hypothetical protein K2H54_000388 [Gekko kuhli]